MCKYITWILHKIKHANMKCSMCAAIRQQQRKSVNMVEKHPAQCLFPPFSRRLLLYYYFSTTFVAKADLHLDATTMSTSNPAIR